MLRLISVVLIVVVLGAGCASFRDYGTHACATCGKSISGEYVELDGDYYHPPHLSCAYCNKPLEGGAAYIPDGEKLYHRTCYAGGIIVCAYCGEITDDTFVTYRGSTYHSGCVREHVITCAWCGEVTAEDTFVSDGADDYHRSCYQKHVVPCDFCGNPIQDETFSSREGKRYHTACFEDFVALRCALCKEPIEGEYVSDFWGGAYHPSHRGEATPCDFCGRLSGARSDRAVTYDDGRLLCGSCHASAMKTEQSVQQVAADVASRLRRIGLDVDAGAVTYHIVGAREMRRLNRQNMQGRHRPEGLTTCIEVVDAPGRTTYENVEVYVLYGMPRVQLMAALAHELTHVWQLVHCPLKVKFTLAEGSCQYATYRVLQDVPGGETGYVVHKINEDTDRAYGKGFRRVRRYAEENGVRAWLELLRTNGSLPDQR